MKIRRFKVENFGSYPVLEMSLEGAGLCLIYGPTGVGKSTIMDAVCWCLYGMTAKGGTADEVRSWGAEEPTKGSIIVESKGNEYVIDRVRGKAHQNDLVIHGARGVNVVETQKFINESLGADYYAFVSSAYFNEFSPSGNFFVARAKERRELFEGLANLLLPNTLAERLSLRKSAKNKKLAGVSEAFIKEKATVDNLTHTVRSIKSVESLWEHNHQLSLINIETDFANYDKKIQKEADYLKGKSEAFVSNKKVRLDDLQEKLSQISVAPEQEFADRIAKLKAEIDKRQESTCNACGQKMPSERSVLLEELEQVKTAMWKNSMLVEKRKDLMDQIARVQDEKNHYEEQLKILPSRPNPYSFLLEAEKEKTNPHTDKLKAFQNDLDNATERMKEQESLLTALKSDLSHLEQLQVLCPILRAELLKMAIRAIQDNTNNYLEKYFDSELRIQFTLDGDSLEVEVQKSGHPCTYRQLSKGQRQLLKLSFALSVMFASFDQSGVKFENLFFDEALDGLDESLKLKAFNLFEALSPGFSSVFLIDHAPAFQNMFAKKYRVGSLADKSFVKEENE
jgi:DNA repair exonuclease SbcCD ATPase subunit